MSLRGPSVTFYFLRLVQEEFILLKPNNRAVRLKRFCFTGETPIAFTAFSLDSPELNIPLVVSVMKLTITGYSANIPLVVFYNQRLFVSVFIRARP